MHIPRNLKLARQLMNLKTADQKPRMTRMTRIETTSIESVLQMCLHPVGESDARRKQFIIREIRGRNCFFQDESN